MDRATPDITSIVAGMESDLEELKTRQFTGQNSGMLFKDISPVSGFIETIAGSRQNMTMITNNFMPDHSRPAICVPHIEIQGLGLIVEEYGGSSVYMDSNYSYYQIYDSSHTTLMGELDLYYIYHMRGTLDGSYAWQTIAYTYSQDYTYDLGFTITLRSTDSGTHSVNVEAIPL